MKLKVLNEKVINPYSKKEVDVNKLSDHVYKRVRKSIGNQIKYYSKNTKLDEFALGLIRKMHKNNPKASITIIDQPEDNCIVPLSAFYRDTLLLSKMMLNYEQKHDYTFLFENVSNSELELLGIKIEEMDTLFKELFEIKNFEEVKRFLDEMEKKHPGVELGTQKSHQIIKSILEG